MAVLDTMAAKLLPGLSDKMAAKQANRQQQNTAPKAPEGTSFEPDVTGQVCDLVTAHQKASIAATR
jgi:hypothetical protein